MATAPFGTFTVHPNEKRMKQNAFYDSLSAVGRFRFWRPLSAATILTVLGICTSEPAFSQPSSAAELHVKDIQIQGNQLIPSEEILHVLKTEKGDIFFRDQLVEDLKAINKLGWFDEYSSRIDPQLVDGAIVLKIIVEENPTVNRIVFKGNKDVREKELLPIFAEQLGKPQNIELIGKAIDKIEKYFCDRGYVLARVVDLIDSGNGNCVVVVDEGVIGEVEVDGGTTLKEYLQKHIKIKPGQIYNDRILSNELKNMQADGFDMKLRRSLSASASDPSRYKLRVEQVYSDAPLVVAKGHAKPVFSATGAFAAAGNSDSRPFKESPNGTNPLLDRLKRQRAL
jgi:outer membrane protein assembly factor BamA